MQYLYNFLIVFLALLVSQFIKPFIGSYANRKGENLATKEDIAQLTRIAEGIKADISDDVWGRQRRWELRRDAVLDAIRAHADLESALVKLNSCLSASEKNYTDKTDPEFDERIQDFRNSWTSCRRAYLIANLAVGGQFSNALSAYSRLTRTVVNDVKLKKSFLTGAKNKDFVFALNGVILSAREALGIKDAGDLPSFDDLN
jgi:hypothetical protein